MCKVFGNFLTQVIQYLAKILNLVFNLLIYLAYFYCRWRPNIEQITEPSGHTDWQLDVSASFETFHEFQHKHIFIRPFTDISQVKRFRWISVTGVIVNYDSRGSVRLTISSHESSVISKMYLVLFPYIRHWSSVWIAREESGSSQDDPVRGRSRPSTSMPSSRPSWTSACSGLPQSPLSAAAWTEHKRQPRSTRRELKHWQLTILEVGQ